MSERVSDAAGRFVESLSRRRFLHWLGAGGAALAAGIRSDRLGAPAFAHGVACHQIPAFHTFNRRFTHCVPEGNCFGLDQEIALERRCERLHRGQCDPGLHCAHGTKCKPFLRMHRSHFKCGQVDASNCGGCPTGHVCCECETTGRPPPNPQCGCLCVR